MGRIRKAVAFVLSAVWIAATLVFGGAKLVIDLIGRSTVLEDGQALADKLPDSVAWLTGLPAIYALIPLMIPSVMIVWIVWPVLAGGADGNSAPQGRLRKRTRLIAARSQINETLRSINWRKENAFSKSELLESLQRMKPELESCIITIKKAGLEVPDLKNFNELEFNILATYLHELAPYLNDGHLKEAREKSRRMTAEMNAYLSSERGNQG